MWPLKWSYWSFDFRDAESILRVLHSKIPRSVNSINQRQFNRFRGKSAYEAAMNDLPHQEQVNFRAESPWLNSQSNVTLREVYYVGSSRAPAVKIGMTVLSGLRQSERRGSIQNPDTIDDVLLAGRAAAATAALVAAGTAATAATAAAINDTRIKWRLPLRCAAVYERDSRSRR